jgi:hypothetical protein
MIADPHDHVPLARENEWALQLIAVLVAIAIVAGAFFVLNSASKEYAMADVKAPPVLYNVPLATPPDGTAERPAL